MKHLCYISIHVCFLFLHTVSAQTNRVTDGLLALYACEDGTGDTVSDTSGFSPSLNLTIQDTNTVVWLPGGGLNLTEETSVESTGGASALMAACTSPNAFTIELWVVPANLLQGGPLSGQSSPIFALSQDGLNRNVTVEQEGEIYVMRLRTTSTAGAGIPVTVPGLTLTHLVATFDDAGMMRFYVNGVEEVYLSVSGTLDNWDTSYPLTIANLPGGGAGWLGQLHLAAVYGRALSMTEINQNYSRGPHAGTTGPPVIVQDPPSRTVNEPEATTFSVIAGGSQPLHYQWRRNASALSGETGMNYLLNPTSFADDGALFDVIISNSYGVVTSEVATLSVTEYVPTPAQIDVDPGNLTVTAGAVATFTVQTSGDDPMFYQWRRDGGAIASANQSFYTLQE